MTRAHALGHYNGSGFRGETISSPLGGSGGSGSQPVATWGLGTFLHGICLDSAPVHPLSMLDNNVLNE